MTMADRDNNGQQMVHHGQPTEEGMIKRQEFGGTQLQKLSETSAMAVAAHAKALVEARFIVALQRPRDVDNVRQKLLKACKRSGFARTARYSKPVGTSKVEGWSIRFAEECIRDMGNLTPEVTVVFDDAKQRIVRVVLQDLESNLAYTKDVVIQKTVERRNAKGAVVLGQRINTHGDTVFIVQATDDDLLNKENALVSKALRNHALRLIPGDVLDDCLDEVRATLKEGEKKDPDAERKRLADAFAALNIMPSDLKAWLGHDLAQASPAELEELRSIWVGVRDGETTWPEVVRAKEEERAPAEKPTTDATQPPRSTADLKNRERDKKKAKDEPAVKHAEDCPAAKGGLICDCGADGSKEPPIS